MAKNWKLKPQAGQEFIAKFSKHGPLSAQLLYSRGLEEEAQVESFLSPKYENLHSPFLFKDMKKAVDRIWQAIENNQLIYIYGDYDADAVTANAVLQKAFAYLGVKVQSYIPDRFTEGYGLNLDAFEKIKANNAKLVITVDCGTNSVDAAEFCKKNSIDLIITDHHEVIGNLPEAYALINPKNSSDGYPYQELTGVGVAFKLACGILSATDKINRWFENQPNKKHLPGWEKWLLDLVAIGTVADCHSLLGENRILVKFGLKVLAKSKWAGLNALCAMAGLDFMHGPPDTYTLGFIIAPRLNAAGRLEHANIALDSLLAKDAVTAQQQAAGLEQINSRRQEVTARILSEAKAMAELNLDRKILVLMATGWPKGVVGLVAGKLAEEYGKPAIVLEKTEELATGSARSVGSFNIIEALKYAGECLVKFGGHKQAAGLTLKTSEFEKFYNQILEYAEKNLKPEDTEKVLELDATITEEDISLETLAVLSEFEPFGVDNPKPRFWLANAKILSFRAVGNSQQHLQLVFRVGEKQVAGIAFNFAYFAKNLKVGDTMEAAVELIKDGWNGKTDVKLKVLDIKLAN